jgi:hypothetical protein
VRIVLSILVLACTELAAISADSISLCLLFTLQEHTKAGVYSLNFWKNGERVNVLIDSLFPAVKQRGEPEAAFGHSKNNELWVMILEKAYAKLHR